MKKYAKETGEYGNCEYSLFYIEGSDSSINRYVRNYKEDFQKFLLQKSVACDSFNFLSTTFFGSRSLKKLLLRNNPTLTKECLRMRLKECEERERVARLVYVARTFGAASGASSFVVYEESLQPQSLDYEEKIRCFFHCVATEEEGNSSLGKREQSCISYRTADGVKEKDAGEVAVWDDKEFLGSDLLADAICGGEKNSISPLKFDEKYNIILPLYPQINIKLEPLPKALYILFLRHPEGIILKEISEYADEIKDIYCKVSGRKNPSVIKRLLLAITNPADNPLHKNISLIRQSFLSKLNLEIARNYIPAYSRSKAQYVPLSQDLLELPSPV